MDSGDMEKFKELSDWNELTKCRKSKTPHKRKIKIDLEKKQILWKSKRKNERRTTINISEIREIRVGQQTDRLQKLRKNVDQRSFSVVYGGKFDTLDLICEDTDQRDRWIEALRSLIEQSGGSDLQAFLKQMWSQVDRNGDGKLDLGEITHLLQSLNFKYDKKNLEREFNMVDKDKNGTLDFDEFCHFYENLRFRPEIAELYKKYIKAEWASITIPDMRRFLEVEQREVFESDEQFINHIKPFLNSKEVISLQGFAKYLESKQNLAFHWSKCTKAYQDMDQPLSHYYINSSHNTYLLGDQLKGKSSAEAYIRALQLGCKYVELDCWDGSNNEPIIYHGHTFTSKIPFRDAIKAISRYAFVKSDYPVFLSLENHCSVEQQKVMSEIIKNEFGERLLSDFIDSFDGVKELPSPNKLKRKILVKGKRIPIEPLNKLVEEVNEEPSSDESDDEIDEEQVPENFKEEAKKAQMTKAQSKMDLSTRRKLSRELSDIIIYGQAVGFKSFEYRKEKGKAYQTSSFSEKKSEKFSNENRESYVEHNMKHITRIYPAGSRVDSSNYDPTNHWLSGCQAVALNFQTHDRNMELNLAKFADNGGCGYVLKPLHLRKLGAKPPKMKFKLKIISARQLPKPGRSQKGEIIDPYVEFEILGKDSFKGKTKVIDDNGFSPTWNHSVEFELEDYESDILRIVIMDKDVDKDDFIATNSIALNCLGQGYRVLPLIDSDRNEIPFSWLYIHSWFDKVLV